MFHQLKKKRSVEFWAINHQDHEWRREEVQVQERRNGPASKQTHTSDKSQVNKTNKN